MAAYATIADYADYQLITLEEAEEIVDLSMYLVRASELIDDMLLTAVYDVDDDGVPTSTAVVSGITAATCAQAAWIIENGGDVTGLASGYGSMSLGPLSLGGKITAQGNTTTSSLWSPLALTALRRAGINTVVSPVQVGGYY